MLIGHQPIVAGLINALVTFRLPRLPFEHLETAWTRAHLPPGTSRDIGYPAPGFSALKAPLHPRGSAPLDQRHCPTSPSDSWQADRQHWTRQLLAYGVGSFGSLFSFVSCYRHLDLYSCSLCGKRLWTHSRTGSPLLCISLLPPRLLESHSRRFVKPGTSHPTHFEHTRKQRRRSPAFS